MKSTIPVLSYSNNILHQKCFHVFEQFRIFACDGKLLLAGGSERKLRTGREKEINKTIGKIVISSFQTNFSLPRERNLCRNTSEVMILHELSGSQLCSKSQFHPDAESNCFVEFRPRSGARSRFVKTIARS